MAFNNPFGNAFENTDSSAAAKNIEKKKKQQSTPVPTQTLQQGKGPVKQPTKIEQAQKKSGGGVKKSTSSGSAKKSNTGVMPLATKSADGSFGVNRPVFTPSTVKASKERPVFTPWTLKAQQMKDKEFNQAQRTTGISREAYDAVQWRKGEYDRLRRQEESMRSEIEKINKDPDRALEYNRNLVQAYIDGNSYVLSDPYNLALAKELYEKFNAQDELIKKYRNINTALDGYEKGVARTGSGDIDALRGKSEQEFDRVRQRTVSETLLTSAQEAFKAASGIEVNDDVRAEANLRYGAYLDSELARHNAKAYEKFEADKDKVYSDNPLGIWEVNYNLGDIGIKNNYAGAAAMEALDDDLIADEIYNELSNKIYANNSKLLENNSGISQKWADLAQYMPQAIEQGKYKIVGGIVGAIIGGGLTGGSGAKKGWDIGGSMAVAEFAYSQAAGSAYVRLLRESGLSPEDAAALAKDEASASALVEFGLELGTSAMWSGSVKGIKKVTGKDLSKTGEALTKRLVKSGMSEKAAKKVVSLAGTAGRMAIESESEGWEEWMQTGVSQAVNHHAKDGTTATSFGLLLETLDTSKFSADELRERQEAQEQAEFLGLVGGGARVAGISALNAGTDAIDTTVTGAKVKGVDGLEQRTLERGAKANQFQAAKVYADKLNEKVGKGKKLNAYEVGKQYKLNLEADADDTVLMKFVADCMDGSFRFADLGGENGRVDLLLRQITLDENGDVAIPDTVKHEFTHLLKQYAPEQYKAYQEFILNAAMSNNPEAIEARRKQLLKNGYKPSEVDEELASELPELFLRNREAIMNMARRKPEASGKIYEIVQKAKNAYHRNKGTAFTNRDGMTLDYWQLDQAESLWRDAINAASANVNTNAETKAETNGGDVKRAVKTDANGNTYIEIDADILDGVPEDKWNTTVKDALKKFSKGIEYQGGKVNVTGKSRGEFVYSEYTDNLDAETRADKFRMANNLDEIVQNQDNANYENPKHPRKDDIIGFERGQTIIKVGNHEFVGDIVLGITDAGERLFYDIDNLVNTKIQHNPDSGRNNAVSETWDDAVSNNSISHSNKNVKHLYTNKGDETARARAVQMEQDGATPEQIWTATGWARDLQGNWVTEIDDSSAVYSGEGTTLGESLNHPELYGRRPELGGYGFNRADMQSGNGNFDADNRQINVNKNNSSEQQRGSTFHETQHALQDAEGRAGGSSPEYWADKLHRAKYLTKYRIDDLNDMLNGREPFDEEIDNHPIVQEYKANATQPSLGYDRGLNDARRKAAEVSIEEYQQKLSELEKLDAMELYRNTAGEIEARDAASRIDMTAEERRNNFPEAFKQRDGVVFAVDNGNNMQYNKNIKWRPDLSKTDLITLMQEIKHDIKTGKNKVTDTTNWLFTNIEGKSVFAIYSNEDFDDPTLLYESKNDKAIKERTILLKILEDLRNGRSAGEKSNYVNWILNGGWLQRGGSGRNNTGALGRGSGNRNAGVLQGQSPGKPSPAFKSVLRNLFKIQFSGRGDGGIAEDTDIRYSRKDATTEDGENVSQLFTNTMHKGHYDPEFTMEADRRASDFTYNPISNKETYEAAQARIDAVGEERVLRDLYSRETWTADDTAESLALIERFNQKKDYSSAVDVYENMRKHATKAGQAIQAISIVNRLTPEGQYMALARIADKRKNATIEKIEKGLDNKGKEKFRQELNEARAKDRAEAAAKRKQKQSQSADVFLNKLRLAAGVTKDEKTGKTRRAFTKSSAAEIEKRAARKKEFANKALELLRTARGAKPIQSDGNVRYSRKEAVNVFGEDDIALLNKWLEVGDTESIFNHLTQVELVSLTAEDNSFLDEFEPRLAEVSSQPLGDVFSEADKNRLYETLRSGNIEKVQSIIDGFDLDVLTESDKKFLVEFTDEFETVSSTPKERTNVNSESVVNNGTDTAAEVTKVKPSLGDSKRKGTWEEQVLDKWKKNADYVPKEALDYAEETLQLVKNLDTEGGKQDFIDLILKQAKMRHTASQVMPDRLSVLRKVLNHTDIAPLKEIATLQIFGMLEDTQKRSVGEGFGSALRMGDLGNAVTMEKNVLSNAIFSSVAKTANNIAILPDILFSTVTGKRGIGWDSIHNANIKERFGAAKDAYLDIALDVDRGGGRNRYDKTIDRHGRFATGKSVPGKVYAPLERALGYGLQVTDAWTKGGAYAQTKKGLDRLKMIDSELSDAETTALIEEWANAEARYRTFQDDNIISDTLGKIRKVFNFGKKFGPGDLVCTYTQVAGSLIMRGIEFSPAGYVKALGHWGKAVLDSKVLDGKWKNKDARRGISATEQREICLAFGRAVTGTGLALAAAKLAELGIIVGLNPDDEDEQQKLDKEAGLGTIQLNVSAIERLFSKGFTVENAQLRHDDELCDISQFEPADTILLQGVRMHQQNWKEANAGQLAENMAKLVTAKSFEEILDLSVLSSIQSLYQDAQYGASGVEIAVSFITDQAMRFLPKPIRQVADGMDIYNRTSYTEATGIEEAAAGIAKSLPFASKNLPAQVDMWGNRKKESNSAGRNVLSKLFNPLKTTVYQSSAIADEVKRLSGKDADVVPDKVEKHFIERLENGDQVYHEITGADYEQYSIITGRNRTKMLSDLFNSEGYIELDDLDRIKEIKTVLADAKELSRKEFAAWKRGEEYEAEPELVGNDIVDDVNAAYKMIGFEKSYGKTYMEIDGYQYEMSDELAKEYNGYIDEMINHYRQQILIDDVNIEDVIDMSVSKLFYYADMTPEQRESTIKGIKSTDKGDTAEEQADIAAFKAGALAKSKDVAITGKFSSYDVETQQKIISKITTLAKSDAKDKYSDRVLEENNRAYTTYKARGFTNRDPENPSEIYPKPEVYKGKEAVKPEKTTDWGRIGSFFGFGGNDKKDAKVETVAPIEPVPTPTPTSEPTDIAQAPVEVVPSPVKSSSKSSGGGSSRKSSGGGTSSARTLGAARATTAYTGSSPAVSAYSSNYGTPSYPASSSYSEPTYTSTPTYTRNDYERAYRAYTGNRYRSSAFSIERSADIANRYSRYFNDFVVGGKRIEDVLSMPLYVSVDGNVVEVRGDYNSLDDKTKAAVLTALQERAENEADAEMI